MEQILKYAEWIALAVAIGVGAYNWYVGKRPVTVENVLEAAKEVEAKVPTLREVVREAVFGVEQLRRAGKIEDNNVAWDRMEAYVKTFYPEVDMDTLRIMANGFILVASQITKGLKAGK